MKNYSEIIRDLREDRDFTQSYIANILGTTQQQYSKYENGTTEIPLRILLILSKFYEVSTDFLLNNSISQKESTVYLKKSEKQLLNSWSQISKEQQLLLLKLIDTMTQSESDSHSNSS